MNYIFIILCFLLSFEMSAQEGRTYIKPTELNHNYGFYYFNEDKYFINVKSSLHHSTEINKYSKEYFYRSGILKGLTNIDFAINASKKLNNNWFGGINSSIFYNNEYSNLSCRPNFVHLGKVYRLQFLKEVGLDFYQNKIKQILATNTGQTSQINAELYIIFDASLALAYKFKIKELPLRILLKGNVSIINEIIENVDEKIYDKGLIDLSSLKLTCSALLFKSLHFSVFGEIQNKYIINLELFTTKTPIIGWEFNYFLGNPNKDGNYSFIF